MKSIKIQVFLALCLLLSGSVFSQQQIVNFTYDDSGNRHTRFITVEILPKSDSIKSEEFNIASVESRQTKAYPNPTYALINIEIGDDILIPAQYTLTDQSGRIVLSEQIIDKSTIVDLTNQNAGAYFLLLTNPGKSISFKIVKQ
jgi:hypothetical protein